MKDIIKNNEYLTIKENINKKYGKILYYIDGARYDKDEQKNGLYYYDMRDREEYNFSIEKAVFVNHIGTLISTEKIEFIEKGGILFEDVFNLLREDGLLIEVHPEIVNRRVRLGDIVLLKECKIGDILLDKSNKTYVVIRALAEKGTTITLECVTHHNEYRSFNQSMINELILIKANIPTWSEIGTYEFVLDYDDFSVVKSDKEEYYYIGEDGFKRLALVAKIKYNVFNNPNEDDLLSGNFNIKDIGSLNLNFDITGEQVNDNDIIYYYFLEVENLD